MGNKRTTKLSKSPKPPEPDPPRPKLKRDDGAATTSSSSSTCTTPNERSSHPTPRALVAPSSWTGKLPGTLLHEHCQKQGWNKVEYSMRNDKLGYLATASLSWKNPKTGEVEIVRMTPPSPDGFKPTAIEARHQCAVYALHREVASHKNLQHVLPPEHRIFWQHLEGIRKQDIHSGKDHFYNTDPFLVKRQREALLLKLEAQRAEAETKNQSKESRALQDLDKDRKWESSPVIEMDLQTRRMIEEVIRKRYVWREHEMSPSHQEQTIENLSKLGFRRSHVQEACEFSHSEEEALEWLLIYVPEDDLPARFLPRDYATGVSILAPTQESLAIDYSAQRLARGGYPLETCRQSLVLAAGDEFLAAEMLFKHLLGITGTEQAEDHDCGVWTDELLALKEIYSSRFSILNPAACAVQLSPQSDSELPKNIILEFQRSRHYPNFLPPHLVVLSEPKLPAHVRLSLIRQAGIYAWESLRGMGMLYALAEWMVENIGQIVRNPGRLSDLDGAVIGRESNAFLRLPCTETKSGVISVPIDWTPRASLAPREVPGFRKSLPAWKHQEEINFLTQTNRVVVITGETGSGKSTQVPQFLLDSFAARGLYHAVDIICAQPRRISAIGLADRVAEERGDKVGMIVGYSIRGEVKSSRATKLRFVTTGVLLRRFLNDPELTGVSHVIVDEVHERTVDGDFLLFLLKELLAKRKDLTVILMSATVAAEEYATYFSKYSVARVHIKGRTFPIQDIYLETILRATGYRPPIQKLKARSPEREDQEEGVLETLRVLDEGVLDYELIASTVQLVCQKDDDHGGILIFLPGIAEISRSIIAIKSRNISSKLHILPLHASLPSHEQRKVFDPPPSGKRKVIVSTNVAETSITIDDITTVIDSGKVKQLGYDVTRNIVILAERWASHASVQQRRGRAGRVGIGTCYKLFSETVEQTKMDRQTAPEIQRIPLEQLCLTVLGMGWTDVVGILGKTLTPPKVEVVQRAMATLRQVGAIDGDRLSAMGRHMAAIPADLRCSKLMVLGSIFGCLESTVTIASILTVKSPFVSPSDKREAASEARNKFSDGSGDLLADASAFHSWHQFLKEQGTKAARKWCDENFLSFQTLLDISSMRTSYLLALQEAGLIRTSSSDDVAKLSAYSSNSLVRSLVAAALYPNVAWIVLPATKYEKLSSGTLALDPEAKAIKLFVAPQSVDQPQERVFIHPTSTLFSARSFIENSPFGTFFSSVQTTKLFLRDFTPVSALAVMLLCGDEVEIDHFGRGMKVQGIKVKAWARIGTLIAILRRLLDERLKWKYENPEMDILQDDVIVCLRKLVQG